MRFTQEQMELLVSKLQDGLLTTEEFILLLKEPAQPKVDKIWNPDIPEPTINPYHPFPYWYATCGNDLNKNFTDK